MVLEEAPVLFMALEEVVVQFPELAEPIANLTKMMKIVGGLFGVYLILWIVAFIYNIRKGVLLRRIIRRLDVLDGKIDKLSRKRK
jgi:hypothetical protein